MSSADHSPPSGVTANAYDGRLTIVLWSPIERLLKRQVPRTTKARWTIGIGIGTIGALAAIMLMWHGVGGLLLVIYASILSPFLVYVVLHMIDVFANATVIVVDQRGIDVHADLLQWNHVRIPRAELVSADIESFVNRYGKYYGDRVVATLEDGDSQYIAGPVSTERAHFVKRAILDHFAATPSASSGGHDVDSFRPRHSIPSLSVILAVSFVLLAAMAAGLIAGAGQMGLKMIGVILAAASLIAMGITGHRVQRCMSREGYDNYTLGGTYLFPIRFIILHWHKARHAAWPYLIALGLFITGLVLMLL